MDILLHFPLSEDAMANTEDECASCGKKGKKKCGRCMEVKYCSRECQVGDWRMHKVVCCPDSMGEDIDRDLAEFSAMYRQQYKSLRRYVGPYLTRSKPSQEGWRKRFVSSNPWPSKQVVEHYLKTHEFAQGDGLKMLRFYNHSLAKELYNAGGVSDPVERRVALRRVGWKIKAHGERVAGERDLRGIRRCMLLHFCLLGVIIKRSVTPSQASDFNNVFVARLIWAWDGIGPWKTRL